MGTPEPGGGEGEMPLCNNPARSAVLRVTRGMEREYFAGFALVGGLPHVSLRGHANAAGKHHLCYENMWLVHDYVIQDYASLNRELGLRLFENG